MVPDGGTGVLLPFLCRRVSVQLTSGLRSPFFVTTHLRNKHLTRQTVSAIMADNTAKEKRRLEYAAQAARAEEGDLAAHIQVTARLVPPLRAYIKGSN